MAESDHEMSPIESVPPGEAVPAPLVQAGGPTPRMPGLGRLLTWTIAAGVLAGVVSCVAGEFIMDAYRADMSPTRSILPSADDVRKLKVARVASPALTFLALGGLLGLALGLAGGMLRRPRPAVISTAVLGLLLGATVTGAVARFAVTNFYNKYDPQSGDLLLPLLTHGAIWSTAGALGGLAFGVGLGSAGRWKAGLGGGIAGGAIAAIIYEIAGALIFASDKTDLPLSPAIAPRVIAQLLVAILIAVGTAVAVHQSAKSEAEAAAPVFS